MWKQLSARHGREFIRHIVPAVIKPLHALWNELIGFVFLCFAAIFGFRTLGYVRQYLQAAAAQPAARDVLARALLTGLCALVMAWFGVTSFLRARKISRS